MPTPRKTIAVKDVLDIANRILECSPDSDQVGRGAVITMLCSILHQTNSYAGFSYTEKSGIDYKSMNVPNTIKDDTRRRYHAARWDR